MSGSSGYAFMDLIASMNPGIVPPDDAQDMQNGATKIPGEVTNACRAGQTVIFHQGAPKHRWYWELPGGQQIPYTGD